MLVGIGPGVHRIKDYTNRTDVGQIDWQSNQGDTLDTLKLIVNDPFSTYTIAAEDDVILMDENDSAGWPTVNLLKNGDFQGNTANWGAASLTGYSAVYDGTVGKYGSGSAKLTFNNVANGSFWYFTQSVNIPTDENGNLLTDQPYTGSIWYLSGGLSNIGTPNIYIEWWTANFASQIRSDSGTFGITLDKAGYNNWRRLYVTATPPSNAACMKLSVFGTTTSATNSGSLWLDAAQLERNTFGSVNRTNFPVPLFNTKMDANGRGSNYVDDWTPDAGGSASNTNVSFSVVTSPALFTSAQQIALSSVDGNSYTRAFAHDRMPINWDQVYTVSMNYQITSAASATFGANVPATAAISDPLMTGATGGIVASTATGARLPYASPAKFRSVAALAVLGTFTTTTATRSVSATAALVVGTDHGFIVSRIGLNTLSWDGSNMNYVSNIDARGPDFDPVTGGWSTLSFQIGPNTPNPMPSNVTHIKVYCGILCEGDGGAGNIGGITNASMTIVIGQVQVAPATQPYQPMTALQTANQAYIYPTPFCGSVTAGTTCHFDNTVTTGYWYRQSRYFGGFARHCIFDYTMGPERQIEVDAVDYGILLAEAPATFVINQQKDSAAIKQACDYAKNQGYLEGLDYTTYVANIVTVDSMLFNWQTTRDVLSKIANQAVAAFWVDAYKYLHYQSALANSAPFGVSDNPDMATTYPMYSFKFDSDSTNTLTEPVIEGSTQLSAPQTFNNNGYNSTTTAAINNNTTVTSIAVTATNAQISSGSIVQVSAGANYQQFTVASTVAANATSIPVNSQVANNTYASASAVAVVGYTLYNGAPIAQVDSANPGTGGVTVGLQSTNTYSQGYGALLNPASGILTFQTSPATSATNNVTIVYRYAAPVIVRVHYPSVYSGGAPVRRKIHHHVKQPHITSQQAAIDRANAELNTSGKPKPTGELYIMSPPVPFNTGLTVGMAIQITHQAAGLNNTLFQITSIDTKFHGNGIVERNLKIGFYRPDFIIFHAQLQRESDESNDNAGTILQDILTASDGWTVGDRAVATTSNIYKWSTGSTSGAGIWGSNAGTGVWG